MLKKFQDKERSLRPHIDPCNTQGAAGSISLDSFQSPGSSNRAAKVTGLCTQRCANHITADAKFPSIEAKAACKAIALSQNEDELERHLQRYQSITSAKARDYVANAVDDFVLCKLNEQFGLTCNFGITNSNAAEQSNSQYICIRSMGLVSAILQWLSINDKLIKQRRAIGMKLLNLNGNVMPHAFHSFSDSSRAFKGKSSFSITACNIISKAMTMVMTLSIPNEVNQIIQVDFKADEMVPFDQRIQCSRHSLCMNMGYPCPHAAACLFIGLCSGITTSSWSSKSGQSADDLVIFAWYELSYITGIFASPALTLIDFKV